MSPDLCGTATVSVVVCIILKRISVFTQNIFSVHIKATK